jgi:hypothetical protein
MTENLLLEEADFKEFRQHCRSKGFDLSYYCSEISGAKEEIARYQFDTPKVIKLRKRRFGFVGLPYDVAEWQQESWHNSLPKLKEEFFQKVKVGKLFPLPVKGSI